MKPQSSHWHVLPSCDFQALGLRTCRDELCPTQPLLTVPCMGTTACAKSFSAADQRNGSKSYNYLKQKTLLTAHQNCTGSELAGFTERLLSQDRNIHCKTPQGCTWPTYTFVTAGTSPTWPQGIPPQPLCSLNVVFLPP